MARPGRREREEYEELKRRKKGSWKDRRIMEE